MRPPGGARISRVSLDRRRLAAHVAHHARGDLDELAVRLRHLAVRQDRDCPRARTRTLPPSTSAVASMRHWQWLMPMTSHSLPGASRRDLLLELHALDGRRDAAEHVDDERELERRLRARPCRGAARRPACARCRSTRARASRPASFIAASELDDLRVRVREDHVEDELLLLARSTSSSSSCPC